MPRLPTIRVIGSQDISTSFRSLTGASRSGAVTVAMLSLLPPDDLRNRSPPWGRWGSADGAASYTKTGDSRLGRSRLRPATRGAFLIAWTDSVPWAVGVGVVSGGELRAAMPPLRLLVRGGVGE